MIITSRPKFFILIQVSLIFLFKSTCKNILNHIIHSFLMLSTLCFGVRNQSLDAETRLGINQILRQNWDSNHQWPIGYSRKRKQLNKNRKLYGDEVGTSTNRSGGCKMFANKWERITVFLPLEIWGLQLNLIQHFLLQQPQRQSICYGPTKQTYQNHLKYLSQSSTLSPLFLFCYNQLQTTTYRFNSCDKSIGSAKAFYAFFSFFFFFVGGEGVGAKA